MNSVNAWVHALSLQVDKISSILWDTALLISSEILIRTIELTRLYGIISFLSSFLRLVWKTGEVIGWLDQSPETGAGGFPIFPNRPLISCTEKTLLAQRAVQFNPMNRLKWMNEWLNRVLLETATNKTKQCVKAECKFAPHFLLAVNIPWNHKHLPQKKYFCRTQWATW